MGCVKFIFEIEYGRFSVVCSLSTLYSTNEKGVTISTT